MYSFNTTKSGFKSKEEHKQWSTAFCYLNKYNAQYSHYHIDCAHIQHLCVYKIWSFHLWQYNKSYQNSAAHKKKKEIISPMSDLPVCICLFHIKATKDILIFLTPALTKQTRHDKSKLFKHWDYRQSLITFYDKQIDWKYFTWTLCIHSETFVIHMISQAITAKEYEMLTLLYHFYLFFIGSNHSAG